MGTILIGGVFAFAVLVFDVTVRADTPWYEDAPWKHLIALALMLLGMVAKYTYDVIERRHTTGSREVAWDWLDFAQPFTVAVISFGAFWQLHGDEVMSVNGKWLGECSDVGMV